MNNQSANRTEKKNLQLNIKGCGAQISLHVREDISAMELSTRLEKDLHISMGSNVFNIAGKRIAGSEEKPLLGHQSLENNGSISLIIESAPLLD